MDGSGLSFILIPIVVSISLGAWLVLVYYADARPQWARKGRRPGWQQDQVNQQMEIGHRQ